MKKGGWRCRKAPDGGTGGPAITSQRAQLKAGEDSGTWLFLAFLKYLFVRALWNECDMQIPICFLITCMAAVYAVSFMNTY